MMKKLGLIITLFLLVIFSANAQEKGWVKQKHSYCAIVGNFGYHGNAHYGGGANIQYTWGIGTGRQRFNVGFGLRINTFFTKKRYYATSSQELIALNMGGADSLYFSKIQTNTLNGYFTLQFNIKPGADIFLNTDIGGINFGASRRGDFLSYETNPIFNGLYYNTDPYAFNLNIPPYDSYGSIMTEAYGQFRINSTISWRLGVNILRTEFKSITDVPFNGRRFSQINYMAMGGLAFNLRKNKDYYDRFYRDL